MGREVARNLDWVHPLVRSIEERRRPIAVPDELPRRRNRQGGLAWPKQPLLTPSRSRVRHASVGISWSALYNSIVAQILGKTQREKNDEELA